MLSVAIRFALLVLCTSAIAQAQPTRATRQLPAPSDIDPQLTEELQRQEQNFASAIIQKDAEALERIVAAEFTLRVADIPQSSLPRAMWMRNTLGPLKAESYQITYSPLLGSWPIILRPSARSTRVKGRSRAGTRVACATA